MHISFILLLILNLIQAKTEQNHIEKYKEFIRHGGWQEIDGNKTKSATIEYLYKEDRNYLNILMKEQDYFQYLSTKLLLKFDDIRLPDRYLSYDDRLEDVSDHPTNKVEIRTYNFTNKSGVLQNVNDNPNMQWKKAIKANITIEVLTKQPELENIIIRIGKFYGIDAYPKQQMIYIYITGKDLNYKISALNSQFVSFFLTTSVQQFCATQILIKLYLMCLLSEELSKYEKIYKMLKNNTHLHGHYNFNYGTFQSYLVNLWLLYINLAYLIFYIYIGQILKGTDEYKITFVTSILQGYICFIYLTQIVFNQMHIIAMSNIDDKRAQIRYIRKQQLVFLMGIIILPYFIFKYGVTNGFVILIMVSSVWLPQIYKTIKHGFKQKIEITYHLFMSANILYVPLYFQLSGNWLYYQGNGNLFLAVSFYVVLQISTIYYQQTIPRLNLSYDYLKHILDQIYAYDTNFENDAALSSDSHLTPLISDHRTKDERTQSRMKKIKAYECTVCLESMETSPDSDVKAKEFCKTPCGHRFHQECLRDWMEYNAYCPICRDSLPYYQYQS